MPFLSKIRISHPDIPINFFSDVCSIRRVQDHNRISDSHHRSERDGGDPEIDEGVTHVECASGPCSWHLGCSLEDNNWKRTIGHGGDTAKLWQKATEVIRSASGHPSSTKTPTLGEPVKNRPHLRNARSRLLRAVVMRQGVPSPMQDEHQDDG